MKYRKSLLIMLAGAMLCSACAKNSGNSEVSDVVQGTSSYAVSTEDRVTMMVQAMRIIVCQMQ